MQIRLLTYFVIVLATVLDEHETERNIHLPISFAKSGLEPAKTQLL